MFNIYASSLFEVVDRHSPDIHCYADDTQLYFSFSPCNSISQDTALMATEDCIADIKQWTQRNCLMLNDDKTEFMIIGTHQQLAKVNVNNIRVGDHDIRKSRFVRNLGTWFDEKFAMSAHVTVGKDI